MTRAFGQNLLRSDEFWSERNRKLYYWPLRLQECHIFYTLTLLDSPSNRFILVVDKVVALTI